MNSNKGYSFSSRAGVTVLRSWPSVFEVSHCLLISLCLTGAFRTADLYVAFEPLKLAYHVHNVTNLDFLLFRSCSSSAMLKIKGVLGNLLDTISGFRSRRLRIIHSKTLATSREKTNCRNALPDPATVRDFVQAAGFNQLDRGLWDASTIT